MVEIVAANEFVLQNMQYEFPAPLYELAQPAGKDEMAPAMLAMFCCKNQHLIGPWFSHGAPFEVSNTINRAHFRGNISISLRTNTNWNLHAPVLYNNEDHLHACTTVHLYC